MEIEWNGAKLFFRKSGTGAKNMLLFHGFGQNSSAFDSLVQAISNEYTCYSFDLFLHGESTWPDPDKPLEKDVWSSFMTRFLASCEVETFSILGYSIGARFCLATFEAFPNQVKEIFLAAPDGIAENVWYRLATGSLFSRKIFRAVVDHPKAFDRIASAGKTLRLVNPKVIRFAWSQMNSAEKRKRVYASWVTFRKLRFKRRDLIAKLKKADIPVTFFVGTRDQLIQSGQLVKFCRQLDKGVFHAIEARHHTLIPELAHFFKMHYNLK